MPHGPHEIITTEKVFVCVVGRKRWWGTEAVVVGGSGGGGGGSGGGGGGVERIELPPHSSISNHLVKNV
jgi:hypothetical protein